MRVLSIDIGTYSIKVQQGSVEKKRVQILSTNEIVISTVRTQLSPNLSDEEVIQSIIEEILTESEFDKLIFQLPTQYVVTRFLTLPVKSKKKALQLLPFQLEDGLFSDLQHTHYIYKLIPHKDHINAQAFITKTDLFTNFYEQYNSRGILPDILVSEQTLIQNYIEHEKLPSNYAILDIGHRTTKAYIINNNEIISNHMIYFGGHMLTELISETYQISYEEAEIYKKDNAFFLTEKQYKEVNEDQKEFALFMKRAFSELLKSFQIWELGYQSLTGKRLDKVYLIGGSAKIKNITNFLSQSFNIKTDYLPPCRFLATPDELNEVEEAHLQLVTMMSSLPTHKGNALNFLHGAFSGGNESELPLFSIAFIGSRMLYISLIFLVAMIIQNIMLSKELRIQKRIVTKKIKSPTLALKRKEKHLLRKRPERLLRILAKKENKLHKSFTLLDPQDPVDILAPLQKISQLINQPNNYQISTYQIDHSGYSMNLTTLEGGDLTKLYNQLRKRWDNASIKKQLSSILISE